MKDNIVAGLGLVAAIILGAVLLMLIPDIHAGFVILMQEINTALVTLFVVGLSLGSAAIGVKIWQSAQIHEIKDSKDGRIARAVVYGGEVVQIGSAEGIGLNELLQMQGQLLGQQQNNMKMIESSARAVKQIMPLLEGPKDDDDGEEEEEYNDARPQVRDLVALVERNSFEVPIGESLIENGTVIVSIEDVHVKIIGSSRKGKSCLAAAIIDMLTQTHDPHVLKVALLDLENKTSKIFAQLGEHIAVVPTSTGRVVMHARNAKDSANYLHHIRNEMDRRYALPEHEQEMQPHILVYIEEFLSLKKHRDLDKYDREILVDDLNELAIRGLKVLIHLMVCAQVDYADEDLQAFSNNFGLNMSFAVRPQAAMAAGFVCSDLLASNWRTKEPGQCVVEGTGCNDLVAAPDYDVKAKLKMLSNASQPSIERPFRPDTAYVESQFLTRIDEALEDGEDTVELGELYASDFVLDPPVETADTASIRRLPKDKADQFDVAYRIIGNIDESLKFIGVGTRYRAHARQIIAERDLKGGNR